MYASPFKCERFSVVAVARDEQGKNEERERDRQNGRNEDNPSAPNRVASSRTKIDFAIFSQLLTGAPEFAPVFRPRLRRLMI